jgi:hypothetical protein
VSLSLLSLSLNSGCGTEGVICIRASLRVAEEKSDAKHPNKSFI